MRYVHAFLILKVRHPAVTGVYCIVRDSRSGCSNDFKCKITEELTTEYTTVGGARSGSPQ